MQARFQGSLGNPAYVAPYLIFTLFYIFSLWINRTAKSFWHKTARYIAPLAFFAFFFMLSQTRAGIVGLGAAIFAFFLYLFFALPQWRKRLFLIFAAVVVIGSLLIGFRNSSFVRSLPGGRIFDITLSEHTVSTRLWTWGSAWHGFLKRPVFGWGPENFSAVFDKYFDPRHHVPGANTETWFDRAHSIYFDYLAETGMLGLVAYLGIFGAIFWGLVGRGGLVWRERNIVALSGKQPTAKIREEGGVTSPLESALLFALLIGYLAQGVAIFDVLPMYINLFLVFAFSHYYLYERQ